MLARKASVAVVLMLAISLTMTLVAAAGDINQTMKKAKAGDARAQNELGAKYASGKGVSKNYKKAVKWYLKAANQGLSAAQSNMAYMYEKGYGVKKDIVRQHMWLTLSGEHGSYMAKYASKKLTKKLTPAQLAQSEELQRAWNSKYGK